MHNPQPLEMLRRLYTKETRHQIRHRMAEEAITMTSRSDRQRQRQLMRQRIRAQVNARRIAVATALAEADLLPVDASSPDEPTR